ESPQISGEGQIANGQIMINYLRTMYKFTGAIGLTPESIYFKNIELTDVLRNTGRLNGRITHNNFYNMAITLDADFSNCQVLNTSIRDNDLFYGQAYATGDVRFEGPLENLRITSNARTEKNTRIYIPLGGLSSVDRKDFINFVNFTDSTFTRQVDKTV